VIGGKESSSEAKTGSPISRKSLNPWRIHRFKCNLRPLALRADKLVILSRSSTSRRVE